MQRRKHITTLRTPILFPRSTRAIDANVNFRIESILASSFLEITDHLSFY
jgi:hypothetical protein